MFCFLPRLYSSFITYIYSIHIFIFTDLLIFKTLKNCLSISSTTITFQHSTIALSEGVCPRIQLAKTCGSEIPNAKKNALNHCSLSYPVISSNFSCFKPSFVNLSPTYKFNIPHRLAHREGGYQSTNMSLHRT